MIANRAAAAALCALGLFVVWRARGLPYWIDRAPGPGFLPLWLGVLLAVCAAAEAVRGQSPFYDERKKGTVPLTPRAGALALVTAGAVALVPLVGLVLAAAALTAGASWLLDPRRHTANALATIATPLVVWLVFVRWLGVPLP